MDPYEILGIPNNATQEEIKKAYRREAMKWHPDRCNNSPEAKNRFHQAAEAYKILSENNTRDGSAGFESQSSSHSYNEAPESESESTDYGPDFKSAGFESDDKFADTVFWEVMLDYAIKLAQSGLREYEIAAKLSGNGCPEKLAAVIADKAFNIHAHYASPSSRKSKSRANQSTFKEERLENDLYRAFLGQGNLFLSPRDTIDYYLVAFREFRQSTSSKPFSRINANKRLLRILNFSLIFFAVMVVGIDIFPDASHYKLLPDIALLQLPLGVLALMFIWTIYRKLWIFTLVLWLLYLGTLAFFNTFMPQALNSDFSLILLIAAICFTPFVFAALFANYFYFMKSRRLIRQANHLFDDHQDKIIWIKNRAGTSPTAALMFAIVFVTSLVYLGPRSNEFINPISFELPGFNEVNEDGAAQKTKLRLKEAKQLFEIAESHYNHSPPDYMKAEMAYSIAANSGSLLAAYKLGYMHYVGKGVDQNDAAAFDYFDQAIRAPLAFQPHSLKLTTEFLAESYNNLGIMYQSGFGTRKNLKKAYEMYSQGAKFGSTNAKLNLKSINASSTGTKRKSILSPTY